MLGKTFLFAFSLSIFFQGVESKAAWAGNEDLFPSEPVSEFLDVLEGKEDPAFCAEWNPEYAYRGHRCCYVRKPTSWRYRKTKGYFCAPQRIKSSFCDEMTDQQRQYVEDANSGRLGDLLDFLSNESGRNGQQSYCSVNNGFLAYGRRLIPTSQNRIAQRTPGRCVDFGTDGMIGMLEWTGRQVAARYSDPGYAGVRLLVGDISAPRGGCLPGRNGRRGHASHTSGVDVDVGFLFAKEKARSPASFARQFEAKANWWLVKQIFQNPFACIKVIFLDRRLISKLRVAAAGDPDWQLYGRFLRHIKNHRNHYHIRIGNHPGQPGCEVNAHPELETDEDPDSTDLEDWGNSNAADEYEDLVASGKESRRKQSRSLQ